MSFTRWLRSLQFTLAPHQRERKHRPRSLQAATHRPYLEILEDRCLLSFSPAASYPARSNPQMVLAAHFNSDSVVDLAVVNYNSPTVSVLLGNADGAFQAAQDSTTGGAGATSLAVGDFDGDGNVDLAAANPANVSVLLSSGNGTFRAPTDIDIGSSPSSVAVGDFNADGNLDLGVTSRTYYPGAYHPGPPSYYGGQYPGYYDPGFYVGGATVLLGNGAGEFAAPITTVLNSSDPRFAAAADLNDDGNLDFATANSADGTVSVLLGNGSGALSAPTDFAVGTYPLAVAAGDLNGDGKLDLVTANRWGHNVSVLLGNGLGAFGAAQDYATNIGPGSVVLPDFNNDGHLDIATANYDSQDATVLLGRGNGTFALPLNFATGAGAVSVAAGDFNGDGWLDAATANNASGYTVAVLINDHAWPPADVPSIIINDVTVTEGNTGGINVTFTVTLSAAYAQPVTVHYATADLSAAAGSDYAAASGDVIIPAGQTSVTFTVAVKGDRLGEPTESFAVNLSAPTNATIGDGQGIGIILDNEPRISISDVTKKEGNGKKTTLFTFTVTLSAAYDQAVTMSYRTVNGTATTGDSDYIAKTGTLTFAPGETTKTITIEVKGDSKKEANETFYLDLFDSSSNSLFTKSRGIGTILNDD